MKYKSIDTARRRFKKLEADWLKKQGEHYWPAQPQRP
jgi:hypothetical protein